MGFLETGFFFLWTLKNDKLRKRTNRCCNPLSGSTPITFSSFSMRLRWEEFQGAMHQENHGRCEEILKTLS